MKKLLTLFLAFVILASLAGIASAASDKKANVTISVDKFDYEAAENLLMLMNQERQSGDAWYYNPDGSVNSTGWLNGYIMDDSLTEAAMYRAAQQAILFDHTQPNGATLCDGIHPDVYMENLAAWQTTSGQAFTSLMEEDQDYYGQGHRRSILSSKKKKKKIGCVTVNGRIRFFPVLFCRRRMQSADGQLYQLPGREYCLSANDRERRGLVRHGSFRRGGQRKQHCRP